MSQVQTIALIAHDGKKDALVEFVRINQVWFERFALVGTGTTSGRLATLGVSIERLSSGP
ncbi:MAG TPA: methylglyoxal synthase, partial [Flavobacteriales bacterium]|nr:methylglyoxal synthase [Flavobacteriales bacterium]